MIPNQLLSPFAPINHILWPTIKHPFRKCDANEMYQHYSCNRRVHNVVTVMNTPVTAIVLTLAIAESEGAVHMHLLNSFYMHRSNYQSIYVRVHSQHMLIWVIKITWSIRFHSQHLVYNYICSVLNRGNNMLNSL